MTLHPYEIPKITSVGEELSERLAKLLGPGSERMLGNGKGKAISLLDYHIKNAKPIKVTIRAPTDTERM